MVQKMILGLVLSFGLSVFAAEKAKPQVFTVEGMHCGGCADTVKKAVCKKEEFATCSAKLIDEKAQIGELRITPKAGQTVDVEKLRSELKDAGYTLKK